MKKVIVQFNIPGMTSKMYDQAWIDLRAAGESNPAGLLHHAGGRQLNDWIVVDVWESAGAFSKFGKALMPILKKLGVAIDQIHPLITAVHFEYSGIEAEVTH